MVRYGLRARLTVRVVALVMLVSGALGGLLVMSVTIHQHQLLVKDGELLTQTLASMAGRYPRARAQVALEETLQRAAARFDVDDIVITDEHGEIVAARSRARVGKVLELSQLSLHRPALAPAVRFRSLFEPVRIEVTAPILDGAAVRGFVYLRFCSDAIMQKVIEQVQTVLIAFGMFVALGIGLTSLYVARITRPLAQLARSASDLAEGGAVQVDLSGRDEVWLLAGSLNSLSKRLGERAAENAQLVDDLRGLNRELASRVERATAGLRAAHDATRRILASVTEAIVTTDGQGRVLTANRAAEGLLGIREIGLRGQELADELPCDKDGCLRQALARADRGVPTQAFELSCEGRADGVLRTLEVQVAPLQTLPVPTTGSAADETSAAPSPPAEAARAVTTIRDCTQRKKLDDALRVADKLSSLGEIAANLTHELGNYANVIRGYCTVLLRDLGEDRSERADLHAIQRVNEQAIVLLDRFALFARPRTPRVELHQAEVLLEDALALLEPKLRAERIELVRELEADLPPVRCNPELLVQAFFNVLLNGLQAMAGPGRLTVRGRREDGGVVVEIEDEGPGIPADVLPRVFDPFFTTKPEGEGTGLGLAIVYRVVELGQGHVSVDSEVGRGTIVRFSLRTEEEAAG